MVFTGSRWTGLEAAARCGRVWEGVERSELVGEESVKGFGFSAPFFVGERRRDRESALFLFGDEMGKFIYPATCVLLYVPGKSAGDEKMGSARTSRKDVDDANN